MQFLYPGLLWALAAISIPILVHLFNFRRFKKVQFSNVEFLKEIKQETKSKSRVKHLLILTSRILALSAIVFAFAQPFIPSSDAGVKVGKKTVGLFIDNSFSMESETENGSILEIAKNKALEIVKYHSPTDVFQLLTNDFEGRHQRWLTQEEITELITEVQYSPQSKPVSEVVSRHKDLSLKEEASQRVIYMLSDLQKSVTNIDQIQPDSSFALQFVPTISSFSENLYIDSAWFESPSRTLQGAEALHVRVKNTLQRRKENIPLRLFVNGTQKSVISINADPGVETDTLLTFSNSTPGFKEARIAIDDYPVIFDDEFFLAYEVAEKISVLEISGGNDKVFSKLFNNDREYAFTKFNASQIDYNRFSEFDLIVINQLSFLAGGLKQELEKFCNNGGTVVLVPANDADLSSYNSFLALRNADLYTKLITAETKISELNFDHFIYSSVFDASNRNMSLPKVNSYYGTTNSSRRTKDVLASLQNGSPILTHYQKGNSSLYVLNTSLDGAQSELPSHSLLVYTMHSIANHSKTSDKLYLELGEENSFKVKSTLGANAEAVIKLSSANDEEFIPEFRRTNGVFEIFPASQASTSGIYSVTVEDTKIGAIGINYNRKESEIDYFSSAELGDELAKYGIPNSSVITAKMDTIRASIEEVNEGRTLWKTFIIMALLFLGIEIILIKFWK